MFKKRDNPSVVLMPQNNSKDSQKSTSWSKVDNYTVILYFTIEISLQILRNTSSSSSTSATYCDLEIYV